MNAATPSGRLLLVEDDAVFSGVLARALERRGFDVTRAASAAEALSLATDAPPRFAVIDLKLGEDNGLHVITALSAAVPGVRILLLTGYASIATAVEAIKRGAQDYLAKPVDADAVVRALLAADPAPVDAEASAGLPDTPLRLPRLEWEHIQRVLRDSDGNISETARRLGMHRRTLQRKLAKHPVRERGNGA